MFTGIVKAKGRVRSLKKQGGDLCITVESRDLDWSSFDVRRIGADTRITARPTATSKE